MDRSDALVLHAHHLVSVRRRADAAIPSSDLPVDDERLAGVVLFILAILGAFAVQQMSALLPYAMGFAAGAMLFVIVDEIVPETHANGNERIATLGTIPGAIVMLYLDVALARFGFVAMLSFTFAPRRLSLSPCYRCSFMLPSGSKGTG